MIAFIARRLLVSAGVLLLSTFVMYLLTASAGDPLEDLYGITDPGDRENRIAARTELLRLDDPIPVRWLAWVGGLAGYVLPGVDGTLGVNVVGQEVAPLLRLALGATLQLVVAATLVAIVTGVAIGTLTALRQYSGFDYTITFASFIFFSLPIFWAAILLKQFGAIRFNTWLADPVITWPWVAGLALLSGLTWAALLGGRDPRRRLLIFSVAAALTAVLLVYLSVVRWFEGPSLGLGVIVVGGLGAAVGITALVSGLGRRRVLVAALVGAVVGIVVYASTLGVLADPSVLLLVGLFAATLLVAGAAGAALGGIDRPAAVQAALLSAAVVSALGFVDWALFSFPDYVARVGGRPIATIGSNTPNFEGTLWEVFLDSATHLLLPSVVLVLISFAQYTRYTRSSMLETMNQDYVRTARAKGLTERSVIVRHAFRNALIPVTTIAALDVAAVLGGAVITEAVFGWQGMGQLFIDGLRAVDPAPVMAFFIVVGLAVVVFNLVADLIYAYLDPRVRLS